MVSVLAVSFVFQENKTKRTRHLFIIGMLFYDPGSFNCLARCRVIFAHCVYCFHLQCIVQFYFVGNVSLHCMPVNSLCPTNTNTNYKM